MIERKLIDVAPQNKTGINDIALYTNFLAYHQAHLRLHDIAAQKLGVHEHIVMQELVSIYDSFIKDHKIAMGERFFATYDYISKETGLSPKQVILAVKELEDANLVNPNDPKKGIEQYTVETEDGEKKKIRRKWYKLDTKAYDEYFKAGDGSYCLGTTERHWIAFNKKIAQKYGPLEAILFEEIYTSYMNGLIANTLVDGQWVYCPQGKLAKKIGKSRQTMVNTYMPSLAKTGLIEVSFRGKNNATHVAVNLQNLYDVLGVEEIFEARPYIEEVTRRILDKVKAVSGEEWELDYDKMADIEKILKLGYTEDQLLEIVENKYNYYKAKGQKAIDEKFHFKNVVGQPSVVEGWLKHIEQEGVKAKDLVEAENITKDICTIMLGFTEGKIKWTVDDTKIDLIRRLITSKEKFTADELIDFALNRYEYNTKQGFKMPTFNNLFSPKEKEHMLKARNTKIYNELKQNQKAREQKNTKDNLKSNCERYTDAEIEDVIRKQDDIDDDVM